MPTWEQISAFITGAGFSVFVAVWFMVLHDKRLENLTEALRELRVTLAIMAGIERAGGRSDMGGREGPAGREGQ